MWMHAATTADFGVSKQRCVAADIGGMPAVAVMRAATGDGVPEYRRSCHHRNQATKHQ
jgi:hypothetical protein